MKAAVKRKRENPNRYNLGTQEVKLLRMKSVQSNKNKLHRFMSRMGSIHHSSSNAPTTLPNPGSPSTNPFVSGFQREISLSSSPGDNSVFGTPGSSISGDSSGRLFDSPDIGDFSANRSWDGTLSPDPDTRVSNSPRSYRKSRVNTLSSTNSVYGTPPEHDDYLKQFGQNLRLPSQSTKDTNVLPNTQINGSLQNADNSRNVQSQLDAMASSSLSSSSGSSAGTETPKIITASQVRTRKESPPNPFFTTFIKDKQMSQSSLSSSSPETRQSYHKGRRVAHRISKKFSNKTQSNPPVNVKPSHLTHDPNTKSNGQSSPNNSSSLSSTIISSSISSSCLNNLNAAETSPICQNPNNTNVDANHSSPSIYPNALPNHITSPIQNNPSYISTASSGYSSMSEIVVDEDGDIFCLAAEAFKSDGTPVTDSKDAKMHYSSVKAKRKLLRRQSTVSSMNNISLDETSNYNTSFYEETVERIGGDARFDSGLAMDNSTSNAKIPKNNSSVNGGQWDIVELSQFKGVQTLERTPSSPSDAASKMLAFALPNTQTSIDSGTDMAFNNSS